MNYCKYTLYWKREPITCHLECFNMSFPLSAWELTLPQEEWPLIGGGCPRFRTPMGQRHRCHFRANVWEGPRWQETHSWKLLACFLNDSFALWGKHVLDKVPLLRHDLAVSEFIIVPWEYGQKEGIRDSGMWGFMCRWAEWPQQASCSVWTASVEPLSTVSWSDLFSENLTTAISVAQSDGGWIWL